MSLLKLLHQMAQQFIVRHFFQLATSRELKGNKARKTAAPLAATEEFLGSVKEIFIEVIYRAF
ncbi:hypothetical protein [Candidatus Tisiphia endosymbiont of Beris chalybata]|uniref:hypothetical protein n=1 Tax=Candidatus Tisiphia endosymbiont of Beris chalybata TaxID=3066262 RepID=UPI00312CC1A9